MKLCDSFRWTGKGLSHTHACIHFPSKLPSHPGCPITLNRNSLPIPKKGNAKECSNYHTIALISHASKVMLKILQVRLQQYMNCELIDVQAGFRKGRGTKEQIGSNTGKSTFIGSHYNIHIVIMELLSCLLLYCPLFHCILTVILIS